MDGWTEAAALRPLLHRALPRSPGISFSPCILTLFRHHVSVLVCVGDHMLFIPTLTQGNSSRCRLLIREATPPHPLSPRPPGIRPVFPKLRCFEQTAAATPPPAPPPTGCFPAEPPPPSPHHSCLAPSARHSGKWWSGPRYPGTASPWLLYCPNSCWESFSGGKPSFSPKQLTSASRLLPPDASERWKNTDWGWR